MPKILVADDNSNIQKMVVLALKGEGIDVVAVGNGEAAVRKLADVRPDLILADVFMPVRNGYEVCEYVKNDAATSNIPVILLVGAFDPLDEQEAQRVRADGVLKKPFVPPDPLISMVKSILARTGAIPADNHSATEEKPPIQAASMIAPSLASLPPFATVPTMPVIAAIPTPAAPSSHSEHSEEDIPARPAPVKIETHSSPLAFGSLLATSPAETHEELADAPELQPGKAPERDWGASKIAEAEEEVEDTTSSKAWRRDAGDEAFTRDAAESASVPDWRDHLKNVEVKEESSASSTTQTGTWTPDREAPSLVAIPEEAPVETVKAVVQEAFAKSPETAQEELREEAHQELHQHLPEEVSQEVSADHAPAMASAAASNFVEESSSASAPVFAQEASFAAVETETATESSVLIETEHPVAVTGQSEEIGSQESIPEISHAGDSFAASSPSASEQEKEAEAAKPKKSWLSKLLTPWEKETQKAQELASTWEAPAVSAENKHAEPYVPEPAVTSFAEHASPGSANLPIGALEASIQELTRSVPDHAGAASDSSLPHPAAEETQHSSLPASSHIPEDPHDAAATSTHQETSPDTSSEAHAVASSASAPPEAPSAAQPDLDAIVAKVMQKMSPEALQAITREILKPVVEAILREETKK